MVRIVVIESRHILAWASVPSIYARDNYQMTVNFSNVGIIGAGAMGRGIAQIAAQAGSERPAARHPGRRRGARTRGDRRASGTSCTDKGKLDAAQRDALQGRAAAPSNRCRTSRAATS